MARPEPICTFFLAAFLWGSGISIAASQDAAKAAKDDLVVSADKTQWVMPAKNYASTRFSELDQIDAANVGDLQLAWLFSTGADRGQEAAHIIVGDTLYVVGPYAGPAPNQVFALNAISGELKWSYAPKPEPAAMGVACCDVVNRGVAYDNGRIFFNTLDNHTVALDAKTGTELWHSKLGEINKGETITMAPLVVKGKVLVGDSGGEMGVRGWVTALDENTGAIVWRAFAAGPDSVVLIGSAFKPFYETSGARIWA
jgi:lanthanide-dependent methanol dehydrogenase